MSTLLKVILYSVAGWIIVLALSFIVPITILNGFAGFLSLLIGFALLILSLISLVKDKHKLSTLIATLLVVIVTWLAVTKSLEWGARTHLMLFRSHYDGKVAQVLSVRDEAERDKMCGGECWVLYNSDRVAFHYAHGFLNWHDLVYDPTGEVMEQDFDKKNRIDTYLVDAEHLSGNWYLVHFGD